MAANLMGNIIVLACVGYELTFMRGSSLQYLAVKRFYTLQLLKSGYFAILFIAVAVNLFKTVKKGLENPVWIWTLVLLVYVFTPGMEDDY